MALKVSNVLSLIQTSFTTFWTPMAFRWNASGEKKEKFEMVSQGVALVMGAIFILILTFKNIIPFFFGDGYENIIYIIPFLMFYPIFYTMSETTTLGIAFSKKTYYNIIVSIVSIIVNLVLNALLIPKFEAIGAAIATGISYLAFFWVRTLISRKLWYEFKISKFIITTIILVIVAFTNCFIKDIIVITLINIVSLISIIVNYREILFIIYDKVKKHIKIKWR